MPARFLLSAPDVHGLPDLSLPEFAFAGRSNVGKSSLLGLLLGQRGMVRTSRTPGRTRHLNLFVLEERTAFVDLPGYGYAKLPHSERQRLAEMLNDYLEQRESLKAVVQVLDARRDEVSPLDRQLAEWARAHGRPLLLAITKIDQVPRTRWLNQMRCIERSLGVPGAASVLCSAKTGEGKAELAKRLDALRG